MHKLDIKDKKILQALNDDGRMPLSIISKKVLISKQSIDYRIKCLMNEGIITQFSALIDISKLGYSTFGVYLRLKNANEKREKEIISIIKDNFFVKWLIICAGKWDVAFSIVAKNIVEFNSYLGKLFELIGQNIELYETNAVFTINNFNPVFLEKKKYFQSIARKEFSEGIMIENIDSIDLDILLELQNNSRQNFVELGQKINISPDVIRYRIKNLVFKGIIKKFSTRINLKKLEYEWYQLTICLKKLPESEERKFMEIIKELPNVSYIVRCVGKWDFEIHVHAKNTDEFRKTLMQIRDALSDYIISYDTMMIFDKPKSLSIPKGVADELRKSFEKH